MRKSEHLKTLTDSFAFRKKCWGFFASNFWSQTQRVVNVLLSPSSITLAFYILYSSFWDSFLLLDKHVLLGLFRVMLVVLM
jgi:hypothetical protein